MEDPKLDFLIGASRVIEEYPSLHRQFYDEDFITCLYEESGLSPLRQKIIRGLSRDLEDPQIDYKLSVITSLTKHAEDNFDELRSTVIGDLSALFHHLANHFGYNLSEKHLYVTTIIGAMRFISGQRTRYEYMHMLVMMSDIYVDTIPKDLYDEVISVCQINPKRNKNIFVKLFLRGIQSLIEWSEGKGGKPKKTNLSIVTNYPVGLNIEPDFMDLFDHDWLKICSHGLYILGEEKRDREMDIEFTSYVKEVERDRKRQEDKKRHGKKKEEKKDYDMMDVNSDFDFNFDNEDNGIDINTSLSCDSDLMNLEYQSSTGYVSPRRQTYSIGLGNSAAVWM